MKKNLNKGKPLFGETSGADQSVKLNKVVKEDKPKRGRPKKQEKGHKKIVAKTFKNEVKPVISNMS